MCILIFDWSSLWISIIPFWQEVLDSCLCRNDSERAGKVNLHDQSCSGFIYYFPYYRRFIQQDSPGGGFCRAQRFWLLLTSWALLSVWWGQGWRTRAAGWNPCAVPASLSQSRSLGWVGPFGKGVRCGGQGWTWVKTELCWAGQGCTQL